MAAKAKMTYETAMERLEEIVAQLDGGSLSLDESVKLFEESTKLAAFCSSCLEKAKLKITELSKADDLD
ncbi:MAG: exodeoxyribonuclease VII small subunit [Clostridia bacterium]|nr:exodeoxyribonuclease VII small subunit [Clostridia bacterium]